MSKGTIYLEREDASFTAGFCILKNSLSILENNISFLHPQELAYFNTLKYEKRKISYLLGRKASKIAISELSGINVAPSVFVDFGVFQFPVVKYSPVQNTQVSITHCEDVGIAFAFPEEHPISIDIERISSDRASALESQVFGNDFKLIASCNMHPIIGYTAIWTIKESASKILRTGLTVDFKLLELHTLVKKGCIYEGTFVNFTQYKSISYICGDYVCSIVVPRKTEPSLDQFWRGLEATLRIKTNGQKCLINGEALRS